MKNLITTIVFAIFLVATSLVAQQRPFGTGLIMDDAAYSQVPHLPQYGGKKYNQVPLKVSLRPYCPTPGNQGLTGSCSAWASGYGGLTILRAIKTNMQNRAQITQAASSVFYLFNQIKISEDCEKGARLSDALRVLAEQGDCLAKNFDTEVDCLAKPNQQHQQEASQYKLKDYAAIFHHEAEATIKINKTKMAIASKTPVVVGMLITESFWGIEPGQKVWTPSEPDNVVGGHAMVVVGYDEVRKAFEVMNSWGPDWGDNGFIWIKYEDFAAYCKYGFQMVLDEETKIDSKVVAKKEITTKEIALSGDFVFRYPTGYTEDEEGKETIAFEEATVSYNEQRKIYETIRKDWQVGEVFQVVAKNIPTGVNSYIFSVSPSNKVELHWPLNEGVDALNKVPLADFVPSKDAEIIVPGTDEALQLAEQGEDYLIILYSDKKIGEIATRINFLQSFKGTIQERVQQTFGDMLIPAQQVKYELDRMHFSTVSVEEERYIVPLVLVVNAE